MDTYNIKGKIYLSVHGIKEIIENHVGKVQVAHLKDGGVLVTCNNDEECTFSRSLTGDELSKKIRSLRKNISEKQLSDENIRTVYAIRYSFHEMIRIKLIPGPKKF